MIRALNVVYANGESGELFKTIEVRKEGVTVYENLTREEAGTLIEQLSDRSDERKCENSN